MTRFYSCFVSALLCALALAHPAAAEKRVALVMGNSSYKFTSPLANPANDANDLAEILRRLNFDVITALDVTEDQLVDTLTAFSEKLINADVSLLFYAGHGVQYAGRNYLLPIDAKLTNEVSLKREAYVFDDIIELMERSTSINLIFIDACRDNPLSQKLQRSIGGTRSTVVGQGLAKMDAPGDVLIAFATAPGDVAEDGAGRNSPFTTALLKNIEAPGIDVEVMLKRVTEEVRRSTNERQRPERLSKLTKEFSFKGAAAPEIQTAEKPEASSQTLELEYWKAIKDINDAKLFKTYVDRFPNGVFVEVAHARMLDLKNQSGTRTVQADAQMAYLDAVAKGDVESLKSFTAAFPGDARAERARELLRIRADEDAWRRAEEGAKLPDFQRYVVAFPDGLYAEDAKKKIADLNAGRRIAARVEPRSAEPAAQNTVPAASRKKASYWDYEGSLLYLVADAQNRSFYYEKPSQPLARNGAKTDGLLFQGLRKGNEYTGTAYVSSSQCGDAPYRVKGPVDPNSPRVTLMGKAPMFAPGGCEINGYEAKELVFDYKRKS